MTKQNLETEYCNERGESSFNTYNDNDYTKWLEKKLIEAEEQVNVTLDSVRLSFTDKELYTISCDLQHILSNISLKVDDSQIRVDIVERINRKITYTE